MHLSGVLAWHLSTSYSTYADMVLYTQDQFESHDVHEGVVGNGSLSTCSSLPASEDYDADAAGPRDCRGATHGAFPSISEVHSHGLEGHEPNGKEPRQASAEAQWQRMAYVANEWAEKRSGTALLPPLLNGNYTAAVSPERQVSPGESPPGLPASRSEGLLSEWTRGSFGSQFGKLFGLEDSYSSEDLLAAFQTELDRSPRKLAKASKRQQRDVPVPPLVDHPAGILFPSLCPLHLCNAYQCVLVRVSRWCS